VPPSRRSPEVEILYATDRAVDGADAAGPVYGYGRSRSLGYGAATIDFDPPISWPRLVHATATPRDDDDAIYPYVARREEFVRFGRGPEDVEVKDGEVVPKGDVAERESLYRARLTEELERRLATADRRDVYVFVHGFNNSFDEVAIRLSEFWHAAARPGVPLLYTWPAGQSVFGYFYDRESGEYTVRHLKATLRFLASHAGVERLHVVAHSRGADIASTALRELHLAGETSTKGGAKGLKLDTVVLAAPDLDAGVFEQRFLKERVDRAARRTTVYFNPSDGAIGAAAFVFGSGRRLGGLSFEEIEPETRTLLAALPDFELIQCDVRGRAGGHDYIFRDPSALSDLSILLREGARAGSDARPLLQPEPGLWRLDNAYLRPNFMPPRLPARRRDDKPIGRAASTPLDPRYDEAPTPLPFLSPSPSPSQLRAESIASNCTRSSS
jgi:esterase/lipase superfamily enzyme